MNSKHIASITIAIITCILLCVLAFGTWVQIPGDSVGVAFDFGKYQKTLNPGLQFKVPFVRQITIVPVERQLKLEFGFVGDANATNEFQRDPEPTASAPALTGDRGTVNVEWSLQYRISDPVAYLVNTKLPEGTLRDISDQAIHEIIGDRTVDEVMSFGRDEVERETKALISKMVNEAKLGFQPQQVQIRSVNPPAKVRQAFSKVNGAQQTRQQNITVATGRKQSIVSESEGKAATFVGEAKIYAATTVADATGKVQRLRSLFSEYEQDPQAYKDRVFLETTGRVFSNAEKVIIQTGDSSASPVYPVPVAK